MNRENFSTFRDEHYARIAEINDKKGKDYAGDDDALANFKAAAEQLGVSPYTIWAVYAHKHWSAIMSFCKEGQVESEPIEGRIHDAILYLFLLLGLVHDNESADCEADGGGGLVRMPEMGPEPGSCTRQWVGHVSGRDHQELLYCRLGHGHVGQHEALAVQGELVRWDSRS